MDGLLIELQSRFLKRMHIVGIRTLILVIRCLDKDVDILQENVCRFRKLVFI